MTKHRLFVVRMVRGISMVGSISLMTMMAASSMMACSTMVASSKNCMMSHISFPQVNVVLLSFRHFNELSCQE